MQFRRTHVKTGKEYLGHFDKSHHWVFDTSEHANEKGLKPEQQAHLHKQQKQHADELIKKWNKQHPDQWKYSLHEETEMLDEAKKKIGEYSHPNGNVAKVYKLSGEHNEGDPYQVQLHKNGKHYEPADYFTSDLEDAHGTAKHFIKESMTQQEIKEMNDFLNEKIAGLGTHPGNEKEEKEDIKLVKKMVKPEALKTEALDLSGLKKGALHKDLGISQDKPIPASKEEIHGDDSSLEKKRKQFAMNAKKWHHESIATPLPDGSLSDAIMESANPWKHYERLEDNNDHSGCVVHMAKHVGDATDIKDAKRIKARHMKEGHLSDENGDDRDKLNKKLWPKFHAAFAPK